MVHGINSENAAERHSFSLFQTDYSTVHLRFCPKAHYWAWHPVPQHNFESADLMLISDAFLRIKFYSFSRKSPEGEIWRGDEIPHGHIPRISEFKDIKIKLAESKQM